MNADGSDPRNLTRNPATTASGGRLVARRAQDRVREHARHA